VSAKLARTFQGLYRTLHRQEESYSVELFGVIAKTNQALIVTKAQRDDDVGRIVAKLSAKDSAEGKHA